MNTGLWIRFIRIGIWGMVAAVVVAAAPLLVAITAGGVGSLFGCNINEAGTDPCVIFGFLPIGGFLSGLGVLGWFSALTIPLGALVFALCLLLIVIGMLVALVKRQNIRGGVRRLEWILLVVVLLVVALFAYWIQS